MSTLLAATVDVGHYAKRARGMIGRALTGVSGGTGARLEDGGRRLRYSKEDKRSVAHPTHLLARSLINSYSNKHNYLAHPQKQPQKMKIPSLKEA